MCIPLNPIGGQTQLQTIRIREGHVGYSKTHPLVNNRTAHHDMQAQALNEWEHGHLAIVTDNASSPERADLSAHVRICLIVLECVSVFSRTVYGWGKGRKRSR